MLARHRTLKHVRPCPRSGQWAGWRRTGRSAGVVSRQSIPGDPAHETHAFRSSAHVYGRHPGFHSGRAGCGLTAESPQLSCARRGPRCALPRPGEGPERCLLIHAVNPKRPLWLEGSSGRSVPFRPFWAVLGLVSARFRDGLKQVTAGLVMVGIGPRLDARGRDHCG